MEETIKETKENLEQLRKQDYDNWKPISLGKKILFLKIFLPLFIFLLIFHKRDLKEMWNGTEEFKKYFPKNLK